MARYGTPLAVILAGTGLVYSPLEPSGRRIGFFLLGFSLFYNLFFFRILSLVNDQSRSFLAKSRATLNLWINVVLVLLLQRTWPPIWLLLMLSAVATAIYGSRERTLVTSIFLSCLIFIVNMLLHLVSPLDWGQAATKAAFIILTSLMINALVRAKQESS